MGVVAAQNVGRWRYHWGHLGVEEEEEKGVGVLEVRSQVLKSSSAAVRRMRGGQRQLLSGQLRGSRSLRAPGEPSWWPH